MLLALIRIEFLSILTLYHIVAVWCVRVSTPAMAAAHFTLLGLYVFGVKYTGQFQCWIVYSQTDLITIESLNIWLTLLRLMVRVTCLISESDQEDWPWLYSLFLFNSFIILVITYIGDYLYFYLEQDLTTYELHNVGAGSFIFKKPWNQIFSIWPVIWVSSSFVVAKVHPNK